MISLLVTLRAVTVYIKLGVDLVDITSSMLQGRLSHGHPKSPAYILTLLPFSMMTSLSSSSINISSYARETYSYIGVSSDKVSAEN
jgi:hypothetical protein